MKDHTIKSDIREACKEYAETKDLYKFVQTLSDITDYRIRYQWVRSHFDTELKLAFEEILYNKNPSDRRGKIEKEEK